MTVTLRVEAMIGNKVILTAVDTATTGLETELIIRGIDFPGLVTPPSDRPADQVVMPGQSLDCSMVRHAAPLSREEKAAAEPEPEPSDDATDATPRKKGRK